MKRNLLLKFGFKAIFEELAKANAEEINTEGKSLKEIAATRKTLNNFNDPISSEQN